MGRRVRLDTLATAPVEDVPGHSAATLVRLRTSQLTPTPLNPRQHFGDDDELTELGESLRTRQLQPVVAISRAAYLKLWPEHEESIGAADFVLVNGERRYRSAVHVGLDTLDAMIREEVADSRAAFLDALLSENLDRKNFDPIEEAHAVEAMVKECGSAKAAAAQFRRHESWVSQRRTLLKLTPELQQQVRAGELSVRIARSIATLPPEEQEPAWRKTREEQAEKARTGKRRGRATAASPDQGTASAARESADDAGVFTAVKTPASAGRSGTPAVAEVIPWESPEALALLIRQRMAPEHRRTLVDLLVSAEQVPASA